MFVPFRLVIILATKVRYFFRFSKLKVENDAVSCTAKERKVSRYLAFLSFFRNFVRIRRISLYKGSLGD